MLGVDDLRFLRRAAHFSPCVRHLLSDGRGNTVGSCDNAGHTVIQHFDAFGVPLEKGVISACPRSSNPTADRARRDTGELGYHGHEGYRTRHYDANRQADLPNASRTDINPQHPDYDATYSKGYESPSTGFIQVGARDYDPHIGRFLELYRP